MTSPVTCIKLTRRLFNQLPSGAYLVSNLAHAPGWPAFAETVVAGALARAAQWERIRACHVDQRLCLVYPDHASYRPIFPAAYLN